MWLYKQVLYTSMQRKGILKMDLSHANVNAVWVKLDRWIILRDLARLYFVALCWLVLSPLTESVSDSCVLLHMHGAIVTCSAEGIPLYSQITRLFFNKLSVGIHLNWKKGMYLMVETPSWLQYRCKRLGGVQTLIMYYLCFVSKSLGYPVINQNEIRCWWRANYQSFNSNHNVIAKLFPSY